ncbi:MAG TPA: DUF4388 domain-containing protein [Deltaproteobacteria bacterium]|nr:DUF4388 domain-containing protein [Deltaproteobacteria bacterium]HQB37706.1 DUF4388 domain-containing protein [Deltaproteobacteria bacterium]
MAFEALQQTTNSGFEGALSGMTLADLIQIKNINRFTGCLTVENADRKGTIFFRDGEMVHAEMENLTGREAFFAIMEWSTGEFKADPKVVTTCRTINESLTYLLLESHRLQDEQNLTKSSDAPIAPSGEQTVHNGGQTMSDINNKLQTIPDVEYAVVQTKEGVPVDDSSYEGATYAANGLYVSMFANQLGSLLGAGELISAAIQGSNHHLLLFQSKTHYLNILVKGTSQLGAVESSIRKVLTQK